MSEVTFEKLGSDILSHVLSFLSKSDGGKVAKLSKFFYKAFINFYFPREWHSEINTPQINAPFFAYLPVVKDLFANKRSDADWQEHSETYESLTRFLYSSPFTLFKNYKAKGYYEVQFRNLNELQLLKGFNAIKKDSYQIAAGIPTNQVRRYVKKPNSKKPNSEESIINPNFIDFRPASKP